MGNLLNMSGGSLVKKSPFIHFADPVVKQIMVQNWGGADGGSAALNTRVNNIKVSGVEGEITYEQAASVLILGLVLRMNANTTSFDELQYFTSIQVLSDYSLQNNSGMTSIVLPPNLTTLGTWCLGGMSSLSGIVIPESVTTIMSSAFNNNTSLLSINIPSSVTSVSNYAFYNCSGLTAVHIKSLDRWCRISFGTNQSNPLEIAKHLYLNRDAVTNVTWPSDLTTVGMYQFTNCLDLTKVVLHNSVTSVGDYAFKGCTSLSEVTLGTGVTVLGNHCFMQCTSLTSITLPNGIVEIGDWCFQACPFTNLVLPDTLTTLGVASLRNIHTLSINIPASITTIKNDAFMGIGELRNIYIADLVAYCNISFGNSTSVPSLANSYLKTFYINNVLTTDLVIPSNVTILNDYIFRWLSITSVDIHTDVTSIGAQVFQSCTLLTKMIVRATTPPTLGANAIPNNNSLLIYVPDTSVEDYKTADGWDAFADKIKGLSELPS